LIFVILKTQDSCAKQEVGADKSHITHNDTTLINEHSEHFGASTWRFNSHSTTRQHNRIQLMVPLWIYLSFLQWPRKNITGNIDAKFNSSRASTGSQGRRAPDGTQKPLTHGQFFLSSAGFKSCLAYFSKAANPLSWQRLVLRLPNLPK
jgi:hypothetical protein